MGRKGRFLRFLAIVGLLVYLPTCAFFVFRILVHKSPEDYLREATYIPVSSHVVGYQRKPTANFTNMRNNSYLSKWITRTESFCEGKIEIHAGRSVRFKDIVLVPERAIAKATGGESLDDVINHKEADEFYKYDPGFYQMMCEKETSNPLVRFAAQGIHFKDWAFAFVYHNEHPVPNEEYVTNVPGLTIALTRYEYANVYWIVMEIYDAFLSTTFYGLSPNDANILIMDAHPSGLLDELWSKTFKKFLRLSDLSHSTSFSALVWNFPRKYSPFLSQPRIEFPLLGEFRDFILNSFNISLENNAITERCEKKELKVLFIWRRDYVAHPRNPSGLITRKISNEQEILQAAQAAFPMYDVRGVQLDSLPMHEQLLLISQADIFIGMHGAAFGFVVLMKPGRAVVELWPQQQVDRGNWHMEALALANRLHYRSWTNMNSKYENRRTKSTYIPKDVIESLLRGATADVCKTS
ncbi:hypothetical protein CAPTEDRAFT_187734 [Capitella teleta]|uniref:EGF domain-specific O-linked N-acetylglucosamine transferase n=1 Tax=Capitella teleta TaxID=283909 RepID=R7UP88_CAPTE|nr:hypothetical protein CAPTEDRAFT_187734 [Capitella teleta]|eukprot:ELU08005.1 hypothetical protein CAPTEDRAFT_187734 [Capitella teleta]